MKKFLSLSACALIAGAPAWADPYSWTRPEGLLPEGPRAGLLPSGSVSGRWESNVDLRGPAPGIAPHPDAAVVTSAGLDGRVSGDRCSLRASGHLESWRFSRRKSYDATNGGGAWDGGWRRGNFWAAGDGSYLNTDDRLVSLLTARINRREWAGHAAIGTRGPVWGGEVRVEGLRRSYPEGFFNALGHRETILAPALTWDAGGRERFFLETAWGFHNARGASPRDGSSFETRVGGSWAGGPSLQIRGSAGALRRRFDGASARPFNGFVGSVSGSFIAGPRLSLNAAGDWNVVDALAEPSAGAIRQKRGATGADWVVGDRTTLSASFSFLWQHYDVPFPDRRRDFTAGASLKAAWELLPGMKATCGWSRDRRGSTRTLENYKADTVIFSIEFRRKP